MDKIRVDGAHGLRFSARRAKGAFTPCSESPYTNAGFLNSTSEALVPKSGINPNKAVFTIDAKSSQILIVNYRATELLGYSSRELCEMQFTELLTHKKKLHVFALAEGHLNSEDGTMVLLSGKVVELTTKSQQKVAVSLWIRQIEGENGCCLAVAEPVERRVAQISIDSHGSVMSGDQEAANLFQFEIIDQINGLDIKQLIPAILLPAPATANSSGGSVPPIPKHIYKQKATGRTQDAIAFPLCLMIQPSQSNPPSTNESSSASSTDSGFKADGAGFVITIWVYTNISGLLVIDENSAIESCNHHFSMFMFGYPQNKMIGSEIFHVIPNFGRDTEYLEYSRSRDATVSSLDDDESETETDLYDNNMPKGADGPMRRVFLDFSSPKVNNNYSVSLNESSIIPSMKSAISEPVNLVSNTSPANLKINNLTHLSESSNKFKDPPRSVSVVIQSENSENNKNMANIQQLTTSSSFETADFESAINESDLLTPVNELLPISSHTKTPDSSPSEENQDSTSYHTADISLALKNQTVPTTEQNFPASSGSASQSQQHTPIHKRLVNIDSKYVITSTPTAVEGAGRMVAMAKKSYVDGKYKGEAIHQDGNVIDILYTISNQVLPCGRRVYCVWISRDPDSEFNKQREEEEDDDERHPNNLTLTFNSITSTVDNSLGQVIKTAANTSTAAATSVAAAAPFSRPHSVSISQCEEDQVSGNFSKYYTTLKQIGKGAYGYVKMAYRNSDRLLVIAKFILKDKLRPNFIIKTEDDFEVPMEIYLLTKVEHPNIVDILDVYENEKFYQMVMEKHGAGMDLFEFIDRCPDMDERLGCLIFRQIVDAVDYLHSLNILHRDIKDENIIIDQNFHIKLIDFGSATFMQKGKLFSTFYGTTEYCSPEVLKGNKYAGPELEVWSLGVTLYVLIFFENPFLDIEETLRAEFNLLTDVSAELENLLTGMLEKDPKKRITVKGIKEDPWVKQEIDESNFNFASLVPCEHHEINPEKYYTGQVYVSNTILSTTSSHDSLSLVDDSSSIGVDSCESDGEGKEKEKKAKVKAGTSKIPNPSPSPSKSTKLQEAGSSKPNQDPQVTGNKTEVCPSNNELPILTKTKKELGQLKRSTNGMCDDPSTSTPSPPPQPPLLTNILRPTGAEKRYTLEIAYLDPDVTPKCSPNAGHSCCFGQFPNDTDDDPLATPKCNKPFLAASPLTASKSENNIFETNLGAPYTVFDVVSLNDLNDACNFPNNSLMNDLSKMQILNQLSDESVFGRAEHQPIETDGYCE